MPAEKALPLDGIPEAPHATESLHAVGADIQAQLSSPRDISAAANFFKPQGAESFLPSMSTPTGVEAAAFSPAPGLEAGLGMPAGAEQISPLINMIMKMPGHLGLASSFFEFLGSFFGGSDLMGALDPLTGGDLFGGMLDGAGEHLGIDLNLLPDDAPGLETLGGDSLEPTARLNDLNYNSTAWMDEGGSSLDESFGNASDLNVGGHGNSFGKPLFETGGTDLNFSPNANGIFGNNDMLAMDPGGGFGSTVGPMQVSGQAIPSTSVSASQNLLNDAVQPGQELSDTTSGGAENMSAAAPDGDATSDQSTTYTVKPGDNLWDIAKEHLGGGEHWKDLYSQNVDVVGKNPDLIHPGQQLHMNDSAHGPSSTHLAGGHGHGATAGHSGHTGHANHVAHGGHAAHGAHAAHGGHVAHDAGHGAHNGHTAAGHHTTAAGHGDAAAKGTTGGAKLESASALPKEPIELKAEAKSLSNTSSYDVDLVDGQGPSS